MAAINKINTYGIRVPPNGDIMSTIAVVGEAAGETEVIKKEGFCGKTGMRFRTWMTQVGIPPGRVRFLNVIEERPLNNDISLFIDLKRSVKVTDTAKMYIEELKKNLLAMPNLNLVIAVGNVSLWALTGLRGINKYRGSVLESTLIPGLKVLPTIHPSYTVDRTRSKNKSGFGEFISAEDLEFMRIMILSDLIKARKESEFKEIRRPKLDITFNPTFEQVMGYIELCKNTGLSRDPDNWEDGWIGFDIESLGATLITYFSLSPYEGSAMSVPIYDGVKYRFTPNEMTHIFTELGILLGNRKIRKIGQNLSYDNRYCQSVFGMPIVNFDDTMIMQATLLPELELKLGVLCSLYTNFPYYKDDRKNLLKFSNNDQLYNARDSAVLHQIGNTLMRILRNKGWTKKYDSLINVLEPLTFMSLKGIKVNKTVREEWVKTLIPQLQEREDAFKELVGLPEINPRSTVQVQKALGITGSTSKINLTHYASKGNKASQALLELRETQKLVSMYVDMDLSDGRVHTFFNPTTTTMRLKSGKESEGTTVDVSGNMQNLTQSFRKILMPDTGYMFIEVDLSQAESRLTAYLSDDPNMKRAFKLNIDIHKNTAVLVYEKIFGKPKTIDEVIEEERQKLGKTPGHSLNYGLGANNFSWRYQLPIAVGKAIRNAYLSGYSSIPEWWKRIAMELAMTGCQLTNPLGYSVKLLGDANDIRTQMKANAWKPQSTVAGIINDRGLVYCRKFFKDTLVILSQVHDAIWFQVPLCALDEVADALILLKKNIETPIKGTSEEFVIPADFKMGYSFYKKDMKNLDVLDVKDTQAQLEKFKETYADKLA